MIFALVAKGRTLLAEHSEATGNFGDVTQNILTKINEGTYTKMSWIYDSYLFHFIKEGDMIYLCLAAETFPRRIAFSFLDDIRDRFVAKYPTVITPNSLHNLLPYSLNEFSRVLLTQMTYFVQNPNADRANLVQGELEQVRNVMVNNIEKVMERGERIELLVDQTSQLNQNAFAFSRRSSSLRRSFWWKNIQLYVVVGCVFLVATYVTLGLVCGFPGLQECFSPRY